MVGQHSQKMAQSSGQTKEKGQAIMLEALATATAWFGHRLCAWSSSPGDIFVTAGLVLDIVGIVALFWFAPEKHSDPQWGVSFAVSEEARVEWERKQRHYRRLARGSLATISVGFALQAIAVVLW